MRKYCQIEFLIDCKILSYAETVYVLIILCREKLFFFMIIYRVNERLHQGNFYETKHRYNYTEFGDVNIRKYYFEPKKNGKVLY